MKTVNTVLLVCACLLTSSCAFHHYVLNPPPGNTAWEPDENSAIILLGFKSDEHISSIGVAGDVDSIPLPSLILPPDQHNVLAVHFHQGEKFQLTGFGYSEVIANASRSMSFEDLPVIDIDERGIYYYGNFYSKDGKSVFSPQFDPEVVKIARKLYPKVFSELEPVNF